MTGWPFAELLDAGRQPPEVAIDPRADLAVLPYSTGTTGLPKGVMRRCCIRGNGVRAARLTA